MEIQQYLFELLHLQNYVHIPGLGTFIIQEKKSNINEENNTIEPDSRKLEFIEEINTKDTIFANYLTQKRNISFDNANYFIEKFVIKVKQELSRNKKSELSPLGYFFTDDLQTKIQFEPTLTNLSITSFGLPPVSLTPIDKDTPVEAFTKQIKHNIHRKSATNWIKRFLIVASIILVLVVLGFFTIKHNFLNENKDYRSLIPFLYDRSESDTLKRQYQTRPLGVDTNFATPDSLLNVINKTDSLNN